MASFRSRTPESSEVSRDDSTLDWPVGAETSPTPETANSAIPGANGELLPDDWIGPYRIVQKLGEGGLGQVYLAEQDEPIRRKVALKIIKTDIHTPEVAARFESEIRAIALLDHPNVTKALDAGTTGDGRPYCVMEYVPGIPITDYCDRNRLTIEMRLGLFTQVCMAIHHAHQKAIIHRDIKATNVLVAVVDGQAIPKVIDFGIVRALQAPMSDKPLVTLHGELLGTPEYMSPEQAEMTALAVDTRSDIYSLGVLLYELLVGALPFEPAMLRHSGHGGIARLIRETELTPLSQRVAQLGGRAHDVAHRRRTKVKTLRRALRGELEWIVGKAMDKDPTRRFASASEFAADVQRFLNREPLIAAPASVTYRLRNFVRGHRPIVIVSAIAVAAVCFGFLELTTGLLFQRRARIEAQQEVQRANAVLEHLLRSMEALDPATNQSDVSTQAVLGAAAAQLEHVFAHEPGVEAAAHSTIGRLYSVLGEHELAETHLRQALATRTAVYGSDTAPAIESTCYLAMLLMDRKQLDEADLLLTQALQISETKFGLDDPQTILAKFSLSRLRQQQGRTDQAAKLCGEAVAAFERAGIGDRWRLARYRSEFGSYLTNLGHYAEAETQLLKSVGDFKALLGEDHAETRRAAQRLETLYRLWNKPQTGSHNGSTATEDTGL
ncbi:MAG: serine/threonine-protein kinase [Phycisphaerales bacterium]|nr:serine/threonine-protein kinase [Phycisphaerales bacterium]MCI0629177.1 serine/threonine-protein kinase [Phycisphaerales bacterium]MCI0675717.1 serine/threonine-protein kinase [Phycisphaerales bacterium]